MVAITYSPEPEQKGASCRQAPVLIKYAADLLDSYHAALAGFNHSSIAIYVPSGYHKHYSYMNYNTTTNI